jgi:hypothetical protein
VIIRASAKLRQQIEFIVQHGENLESTLVIVVMMRSQNDDANGTAHGIRLISTTPPEKRCHDGMALPLVCIVVAEFGLGARLA